MMMMMMMIKAAAIIIHTTHYREAVVPERELWAKSPGPQRWNRPGSRPTWWSGAGKQLETHRARIEAQGSRLSAQCSRRSDARPAAVFRLRAVEKGKLNAARALKKRHFSSSSPRHRGTISRHAKGLRLHRRIRRLGSRVHLFWKGIPPARP